MATDKTVTHIFRQCITLKNGKRICRPPGKAFRIPISDNDNDNPGTKAG